MILKEYELKIFKFEIMNNCFFNRIINDLLSLGYEGGREKKWNKIEELCKINFKWEKCLWIESSLGNLIFKLCFSFEI